MVSRNRNSNEAAAANDTAVLQEVNINLGNGNNVGGNTTLKGSGKDCYGMCYQCPKTPSYCAIAKQYLPTEEYFNYGG